MWRMKFGELWAKWIEATVFSSWMSVLVNRSPTKDFEVGRGLRLGDSLLYFLFLIVAEGISSLVKKASVIDQFSSFSMEGKCVVEILQFADDTLLVRVGSWKHVWALKAVLRGFEVVSGLGVNFLKSRLISINLSNHFLLVVANFLSCRLEDNSFSFLEIQI
ncbi:uncharacterized protein LOC131643649 [Vicia villosa]|uniref:uncharacterized protein LOC131643649 n=1 Tax=Vicia villosa TaxID=3911 RepID=UPI00273A9912|nr:uncharacterized protein LOC131643649 [Vicia villosa]